MIEWADIFVDAGANVGAYSILAAMTKHVQVNAFEPHRMFFNIYRF